MSALVTPRQLADALGVSPSSVKRWGDAGDLRISRTAGGHRRIRVSEALRFVRERGLNLVAPERLGVGPEETRDASGGLRAGAGDLRAILERGDEAGTVRALASQHIGGARLASIADELIAPALAPIGELWREDVGGIAVEHVATRACFRAVRRLQELIPEPAADAPLAIGGAFHGDQHGLGSLLCAAVLAEQGWNAVDLGSTLPTAALLRHLEQRTPALIWLSVTNAARRRAARDAFMDILELAEARHAVVVIGGQGAHPLPTDHPLCHRLATMAELEAFANGLHGPRPLGDARAESRDPLSLQARHVR